MEEWNEKIVAACLDGFEIPNALYDDVPFCSAFSNCRPTTH
jgi:hypothetical protein